MPNWPPLRMSQVLLTSLKRWKPLWGRRLGFFQPKNVKAFSLFDLAALSSKAIEKWESGTISAKAIVEERARLRLGRARARIVYNDLLQGSRPDKADFALLLPQ